MGWREREICSQARLSVGCSQYWEVGSEKMFSKRTDGYHARVKEGYTKWETSKFQCSMGKRSNQKFDISNLLSHDWKFFWYPDIIDNTMQKIWNSKLLKTFNLKNVLIILNEINLIFKMKEKIKNHIQVQCNWKKKIGIFVKHNLRNKLNNNPWPATTFPLPCKK